MAKEKKIKITLVKSAIGYDKSQKQTVRALGLLKMNASRIVRDTPHMRGMIFKVQHLLDIEEVEE